MPRRSRGRGKLLPAAAGVGVCADEDGDPIGGDEREDDQHQRDFGADQ
jgi:hypothetical protein